MSGRVEHRREEPDRAAVDALVGIPTGVVSDCIGRAGAMDAGIRSIVRGRPFVGVALTVDDVAGGNLMAHAALDLLAPGDVLVIAGKGATTRSCWGGIQTRIAGERGAAAVVADGVVRDLLEIEESRLAVYARGATPAGPLKESGGSVNLPVSCGGVEVHPGDVVAGDDDGVVVVPRALVPGLADRCRERLAVEREWLERALAGESMLDVLDLRERLP